MAIHSYRSIKIMFACWRCLTLYVIFCGFDVINLDHLLICSSFALCSQKRWHYNGVSMLWEDEIYRNSSVSWWKSTKAFPPLLIINCLFNLSVDLNNFSSIIPYDEDNLRVKSNAYILDSFWFYVLFHFAFFWFTW